MGRLLKQYEKENMRMAILKQEETFKHQVHELHRLYQVQKVLVNDMKAEIKRQRKSYSNSGTKPERWNIDNEIASQQPRYSACQDQRRPHRALNLDLPAEEYIGKDDRDVMLDVDEDSDHLDLTLAIGSKSRRKKENSSTSDSGATSFSSSSSDSGAKMKLNGNERGVFQVPDINLGNYQKDQRKSDFIVEEHMREERVNQPPWLFHRLSLNMT